MTYILTMIICLVLGFVVLWLKERQNKKPKEKGSDMLDLWSEKLNLQTKQNEPLYACYITKMGSMTLYGYAKLPLGEDLTCYSPTNVTVPATSASQVAYRGSNPWKSVTETEAYQGKTPWTRYYDGDLYE